MRTLVTMILGACLTLLAGCTGLQRSFLFYPTHHTGGIGLDVWEVDAKTIGYCRQVQSPQSVWLILHGNAGQAVDRTYALHASHLMIRCSFWSTQAMGLARASRQGPPWTQQLWRRMNS